MQEHYSDRNITIESVCRELGVSAAYFSTIFKKETGKTFISFLTDYRMEKAVELLMTTSDKTYIIAEKSGGMQILIISVTRLKNSTVCHRLSIVLPTVNNKRQENQWKRSENY